MKMPHKARLVDKHKERKELFRKARKGGPVSTTTPDGRKISVIHWNPAGYWEDHRNRFQVDMNGNRMALYRLKASGARESEPYLTCYLREVRRGGKLAPARPASLANKVLKLDSVGKEQAFYLSSTALIQSRRGRGLLVPFLDYLKSQGVRKVILNPLADLKGYYEDLGFRENKRRDWHELHLSDWHWPKKS